MGRVIDREDFDDADYQRFSMRLQHCLIALRELLTRPGFGVGEKTIGAELELVLVDSGARPLPMNLRVLGDTVDPRVTVELDRFNMECNLTPTPLANKPFSVIGSEIDDALEEVRRAAAAHGGRVAAIGILPTLREGDLQTSAMTDFPRYRALSKALRRIRQEPFQVAIEGEDRLEIECDDVTFEGAATSLQVHLRVNPEDFAAIFNAAQIATAPVLAAAGNSPTFLGRRLWEETRVAASRAFRSEPGGWSKEPGSSSRRQSHFTKSSFRSCPMRIPSRARWPGGFPLSTRSACTREPCGVGTVPFTTRPAVGTFGSNSARYPPAPPPST
jgi:hypothetical protein